MKIAIEGNIGCGKSTVLRTICDKTRIPIFLEPVDTEWKQGLELFYSDHARWGFTFNMNVLNTYAKYKDNAFKAIYERSPLSCKHIFSQLQFESGKMSSYEYSLFEEFYNQLAWIPDVMVYIKTPPKLCQQRMNARARECEKEVPLEYLQSVHDKYEQLMLDCVKLNVKTKVIIVDGSQDEEAVFNEVITIIKQH